MLTNAQNSEDVRLRRALLDVEIGNYIDVGAADPDENSVTKLFYDAGWSGINVEPGPKFTRLNAERPRDINLNIVVGENDQSKLSFFVSYPYTDLSSLHLPTNESRPTVDRTESITATMWSLSSVFAHGDFDVVHFLKVDVEGAEPEVLRSLDWSRWRPWIVVVEAIDRFTHEENYELWEATLVDNGYVFAVFDGINRFYVERSQSHRAELLASPIWPTSVVETFEQRRERDQFRARLDLADNERLRLVEMCRSLRSELNQARDALERLMTENAALDRSFRHYKDAFEAVDGERSRLEVRLAELDQRARAIEMSETFRVGAAVLKPARFGASLVGQVRSRKTVSEVASTPKDDAQTVYDRFTSPGRSWHFRSDPPSWDVASSLGLDATFVRAYAEPDMRVALDKIRAMDRHTEAAALSGADNTLRKAITDLELVLSGLDGQSVGALNPRAERTAGVVVDVRCLQNVDYTERGVGRHARTVLDVLKAHFTHLPMIGLVSGDQPAPTGEAFEGLRLVHSAAQANDIKPVVVVSLSPMTANVAPMLPFLLEPGASTMAVIYDFIPASRPGAYLPLDTHGISYAAQLNALGLYRTFLPISHDAAAQAERHLLSADRKVFVTGVAVDSPDDLVEGRTKTVLVPAGGDARKNPLVAVAAFAEARKQDPDLELVVTGRFGEAMARELDDAVTALGIPAKSWQHLSYVPSADLDRLYATAACVVVPSHTEGYSIPVAHARSVGTPVVASDIPVHRELVGEGVSLVGPADVVSMASAIVAAVRSPRRDPFVPHSRESVASIVSDALAHQVEQRMSPPAVIRRARPSVAVVSPLPPDRTGIADYSAFTLAEVGKHVDLTVFALHEDSALQGATTEMLDARAFDMTKFDATLVVVGNSHFHFSSLDYVEGLGAPVLAHDTRMVESYLADRGVDALAKMFDADGVAVSDRSHEGFIHTPPGRAYGTLLRVGSPLIVHSESLAQSLGGDGVRVLPFVPYHLPPGPVTPARISHARELLDFDADLFHIGLFGILDRRTKCEDIVVQAAGWLRQWGIRPVVHLVGPADHREVAALVEVAHLTGAELRVHGRVSEEILDEFLFAVDVGVQLRSNPWLSLSGAVADLLSFGVPTLASAPLLLDHGSPNYARPIAVPASGLLIAEQLVALKEAGSRLQTCEQIEEERMRFVGERSVDRYAKALIDCLGITL